MWKAKVQTSSSGKAQKVTLLSGENLLTYQEVIDLWISDSAFRSFFNGVLADCPFAGIFWETPPVTRDSVSRDFECMLIEGPRFERVQPDPESFGEHFDLYADEKVVTFPNLGNNAMLVVPCPVLSDETYTHLGNFVRQAPESQIDAFWQEVGMAMTARVDNRPVWLSTAGMGVYWLHVRLDDRPKYYRYPTYKNEKPES